MIEQDIQALTKSIQELIVVLRAVPQPGVGQNTGSQGGADLLDCTSPRDLAVTPPEPQTQEAPHVKKPVDTPPVSTEGKATATAEATPATASHSDAPAEHPVTLDQVRQAALQHATRIGRDPLFALIENAFGTRDLTKVPASDWPKALRLFAA